MTERIPLHVITGFLGSGKTTLLNRVLREPAWADSAVLINEIGAISIDHDLVERMQNGDDIDVIVLKGGCTCCALRGDLVAALRELYALRADGRAPPFTRVVMETTGLADPAPVLFTLAADPALRHKFVRGVIVTTFDAVHGLMQLERYPEARKQVAVADRIVLTKTDLQIAMPHADFGTLLCRINPAATLCDARHTTTPAVLLKQNEAYGHHKHEYEAEYGSRDTYDLDKRDNVSSSIVQVMRSVYHSNTRATNAEKLGDHRTHLEQLFAPRAHSFAAEHSPRIESVAIIFDQPVAWSPFAVWLSMLLHAHGKKLLRFKAFLDVAGWPGPVSLDGIHHMIYPPRHSNAWPKGQRLSRLVFIGQDLAVEQIEPSLRAFLAGEHAQEKNAPA